MSLFPTKMRIGSSFCLETSCWRRDYLLGFSHLLFVCHAKAPPAPAFAGKRQPIVHLHSPYAGGYVSLHGSRTCNYPVFTTTALTESYVGKARLRQGVWKDRSGEGGQSKESKQHRTKNPFSLFSVKYSWELMQNGRLYSIWNCAQSLRDCA